jgi:hypothetical protein
MRAEIAEAHETTALILGSEVVEARQQQRSGVIYDARSSMAACTASGCPAAGFVDTILS